MALNAEILVPGGRIDKFQESKPIPVKEAWDAARDTAHVVYLLWDPRNGDIRYVGQTKRPERRFWDHRHARTKCSSHDWELSLIEQGLCCEVSVVEEGLTNDEANERERWWVAYGGDWDWPLMNIADGGAGVTRSQRGRRDLREVHRYQELHKEELERKMASIKEQMREKRKAARAKKTGKEG